VKLLLALTALPWLLGAQTDPLHEAYNAWNREHPVSDYKAREQSLFEVSADWVAKWPDNQSAWRFRRESLVGTHSRSAELWKQVDENLIRLSPPHSRAGQAAYDWVTAGVNIPEAEALAISEIAWIDGEPQTAPTNPNLADLIDQANVSVKPFGLLVTLTNAQIKLKKYDEARATISRVRTWLEGDFMRYFDHDPLETFPDYQAKYFVLSALLAEAEGKTLDALAFYRSMIGNPYYRREYDGYVKQTRALWDQMGGSEAGWTAFSTVPALPAGVPSEFKGIPFNPWVTLDYKLPEMKLNAMDSRTWTTADFRAKPTLVYLWASWCGPCWSTLPAIQALYDRSKGRPDFQVVTISMDEDPEKLAAFLKEKDYSFPALVGKAYVEQMIPRVILGQTWLVDGAASIRLQRINTPMTQQALVAEAVYKLTQLSHR
jgi:thiol-disulfide isomerase/thioredoxin